jgi:hypothetical protein
LAIRKPLPHMNYQTVTTKPRKNNASKLTKEAHMRAHISPLNIDTVISAEDLVSMEDEQSSKLCNSIGEHLRKLNPIQKNLLPSHPQMVQDTVQS